MGFSKRVAELYSIALEIVSGQKIDMSVQHTIAQHIIRPANIMYLR